MYKTLFTAWISVCWRKNVKSYELLKRKNKRCSLKVVNEYKFLGITLTSKLSVSYNDSRRFWQRISQLSRSGQILFAKTMNKFSVCVLGVPIFLALCRSSLEVSKVCEQIEKFLLKSYWHYLLEYGIMGYIWESSVGDPFFEPVFWTS